MILSSQFPVNFQAILKIEKFWTIKTDLIVTFSHVYADDTKDRKAWNSWNPVNSALFPSPEPTPVIVSFWVVLKSLWLSFFVVHGNFFALDGKQQQTSLRPEHCIRAGMTPRKQTKNTWYVWKTEKMVLKTFWTLSELQPSAIICLI